MKRIEDIEKMGLEELEAAAMDGDVEVPQGLSGRIQERILAAQLAKETSGRPKITQGNILQYGKIAVAAMVILGLFLLRPGEEKDDLQDTFEDPYMAYAQAERALAEISNKMSMGIEKVAQAKPLAEKPMEILNNIIDSKN